MLQVIISPAKQMLVRPDAFAPRGIPPFPAQTARLIDALRHLERTEGERGLQTLWRVNDKLLAQNVETLRDFMPVADASQLADARIARLVTPAAFSYHGIQYRSMAPDVLDLDALDWLQTHLWILSGLYGCVRPFDAVQPYRLEMGTPLAVDGARSLYGFWGGRIAAAIAQAVRADEGAGDASASDTAPGCAGPETSAGTCVEAEHPLPGETARADDADAMRGAPAAADGSTAASARVGTNADAPAPDAVGSCTQLDTGAVVNLASVEYAKAVLPHLPVSVPVVTCLFGEEVRAGKPVQRATASKIARGSMVRWMAERGVEDVADLARFDVGYAFAPELSHERGAARTLVFVKR